MVEQSLVVLGAGQSLDVVFRSGRMDLRGSDGSYTTGYGGVPVVPDAGYVVPPTTYYYFRVMATTTATPEVITTTAAQAFTLAVVAGA